MKTVKIATLILSILSFVFVLVPNAQISQVSANEPRKASFSFELPSNQAQTTREFSKEANSDGTVTTKVVVFNVKVCFKTDKNGNEYYSEVEWFIDVDAEAPTNIYVIVYYKNETFSIPDQWITGDGMRSDTFTLMGDDPDEGVTTGVWFYMGYNKEKTDRKIEVYYEDGRLACTYGPDDDPDLKDIPAESQEYDVKGDPFATPTPSPEPSPYPTPTEPATGLVEDIEISSTKLENGRLLLKTGGSAEVTAEALTSSGLDSVPLPDVEVEAKGKGEKVSISPLTALTGANGRATFTITAKKKTGVSKVTFKAGDVKKSIKVKVSK